jgi:hypothetical protein
MTQVKYILKSINDHRLLEAVTGDELMLVYDPASGGEKKVKLSELQGAEDKTLKWLSNEAYLIDDIREYNLKLWKSRTNSNLGNLPAENEFWTEVAKSTANGIGYYAPGVFTLDPSLVIASGQLYYLNNLVVNFPFESVDFIAELNENKWVSVAREGESKWQDVTKQGGYGYLYNTAVVNSELNITSSDDWRVPTLADAETLKALFVTDAATVSNLKSTNVEPAPHPRWNASSHAGVDSVNFSALPGGIRQTSSSQFSSLGSRFAMLVQGDRVLRLQGIEIYSLVLIATINSFAGASIRLCRDCTPDELLLENGADAGFYIGNNNKTYTTTKIGSLIWTRENLLENFFRDGSVIPNEVSNAAWLNSENVPLLCAYDNNVELWAQGGEVSNYIIPKNGKKIPASVIDNLPTSETVTIADAPIWDENKDGGYEGGAIVTYRNLDSLDPQFQVFKLYLSIEAVAQGVSPEDDPVKWKFEGDSYEKEIGETARCFTTTINGLRNISNIKNGHTVAVTGTQRIYVYSTANNTGIRPYSGEQGSWLQAGSFNTSNIAGVIHSLNNSGEEISIPLFYSVLSLAPTATLDVVNENGDVQLTISVPYPCIITHKTAGWALSDFEIEQIKIPTTMADVAGLNAKIAQLENTLPLTQVRYLRSSTTVINGITYYESLAEPGGAPLINITQAITGTDTATSNTIAEFVGLPVPEGVSFILEKLNFDVFANKNATGRNVQLFVEFCNITPDFTINILGESQIASLNEISNAYNLFLALNPNCEVFAGCRALVRVKAFQTGGGASATATISIENHTFSRFSFETAGSVSGGHTIQDATTSYVQRPALKFLGNVEVRDTPTATEVEVIGAGLTPEQSQNLADATEHINGVEEEKHSHKQIGLTNQKVIIGDVNNRGSEADTVEMEVSAAPLTSANWSTGQATVTGIKGQVAYDANYKYECIGTNLWIRLALIEPRFELYLSPDIDDSGGAKTSLELNTAYPTSQVGQRVWGTDLYLYEKKEANIWKKFSQTTA